MGVIGTSGQLLDYTAGNVVFIALLAMQRSGSSEFSQELAKELGCDFLGEVFRRPISEDFLILKDTMPSKFGKWSSQTECSQKGSCTSADIFDYLRVQGSLRNKAAAERSPKFKAIDAVVGNATHSCAVIKVFNNMFGNKNKVGGNYGEPEASTALADFLQSNRVRAVILERDVNQQYCSKQYALQTHDFSGHVRCNGDGCHRTHPPDCHAAFVENKTSPYYDPEHVKYHRNFVQNHNGWYSWLRRVGVPGTTPHVSVRFEDIAGETSDQVTSRFKILAEVKRMAAIPPLAPT